MMSSSSFSWLQAWMEDSKPTQLSGATTCLGSPMITHSILEPLASECVPILEVDPELVRILMQITEQDLTPTLEEGSMHPQMGSSASSDDPEFERMRASAEQDFSEWKERRRLTRKSSRLSRQDSGGSTDIGSQSSGKRTLAYRHTLREYSNPRPANNLCYYNSDPFHSVNPCI